MCLWSYVPVLEAKQRCARPASEVADRGRSLLLWPHGLQVPKFQVYKATLYHIERELQTFSRSNSVLKQAG